MDKRDFTVIENEKVTEKENSVKAVVTNPIAKKFVEFHNEKKFSIIDLFKK